jgi:hypothetical protein
MFGMANSNLADIYSFLKTCHCPQLERLFVQVSIFSSYFHEKLHWIA